MDDETETKSVTLQMLANHIEQQWDDVLTKWISVLHKDPAAHASNDLTRAQLINHLPELFKEMCMIIKQPENDLEQAQTVQFAQAHGINRWQHGYEPAELVRELGSLRTIILTEDLETILANTSGISREIERELNRRINEFFNRVTTLSVQQFLEEHQKEIQRREEEQKRTNQNLQAANQRLQSLDRARVRFTYNLSHELNNFSNNIVIGASILGNTADQAIKQKMVEMLHRNIRDMRLLFDQLADYSALLSGQGKVMVEAFDMQPLMQELSLIYGKMIEEKGLDFNAGTDPGLELIISDRLKIKQIVSNLLSNALKYTKKGSIYLFARPRDAETFVILTQDTGEGIAKENIERIFEEFHRVQPRAGIRGTGLGLAITKQLVTVLGGEINVTSEIDKGTLFEVVLPKVFKST